MSTDLEISIRKGADSLELLLNDEDVKALYSQLGEYYPEVAKIFYDHGMDIFTPFVADREYFQREIWIINLKIRDAISLALPAVPTSNLKGLPQVPEESGSNIMGGNVGEGVGSATGLLGLPPLILPEPAATPKPTSSIQLHTSCGDSQPQLCSESYRGDIDLDIIPARNIISLPEVHDDVVDYIPEPAGGGQAAECLIGLAFAVPSTVHLDEADLQKSNRSRGYRTLFKAGVESKKGKQPETDVQSYDIGVLLHLDLIHKQPLLHARFEDGENIESMKTTRTMEAIYRVLVDLQNTVKFDEARQIRTIIQRSEDFTKHETCNSLVLAFSSAGFEIPEESTKYDLFNQTILTMRTSTWNNHKDNLWANIKHFRYAQQASIEKERMIIDSERGKVLDEGKAWKAVDKGKGKAVDKGKGKAEDVGYYEEDPDDSLGLERLDSSLELFD